MSDPSAIQLLAEEVAPRAKRTLTAGVALSVILHAAMVGVLSQVGTHTLAQGPGPGELSQLDIDQAFAAEPPPATQPDPPKSDPPAVPPEPESVRPPPLPEMPPQDVRLGIDESTATVETWKGAAQATEHQAPKSEINQPALAMETGAPGPPDPGSAEAPAAESTAAAMGPPLPPQPDSEEATDPVPAPEAQPNPVQPLARQNLPEQALPQQLLPVQDQPQQPLPQQLVTVAPSVSPVEVGEFQPKALQPLILQTEPVQPEEQQPKPLQTQDQQLKPVQEASQTTPSKPTDKPQDTPKKQGAAGAASQGGAVRKANSPDARPGEKAEEESAAASVVESLVYRPGRPLAGKGLQVRTVNPRWGVTTMIVSSPKDTVIRITFGRTGKVLKATFVDSGTGYADVDGPLLDAVYRWTAKGDVLEKIPPGDPQAGLNFDIKFLMTRGG